MNVLEKSNQFENQYSEKQIKEKIFQIISVEYARVIERELNKPKETLEKEMAEGFSYKFFLERELGLIKSKIGEYEKGESFFEKLYLKNFNDGEFNNITAKNLILTYKYRLESFLENEFSLSENLKNSISRFVDKLIETTTDLANFNLQEEAHKSNLIEVISNTNDPVFFVKAKSFIENQSLQVINYMNSIFIERLNNILKEEKILKEELIKKQSQINEDLKKARKIQQNLLPKSYPTNLGIKFYSSYLPMDTVGGDFYDIQVFNSDKDLDPDRVGIIIADVSGHGIAAAFIAAMAKISWENASRIYSSPKDILQRINLQMVQISVGNFLTAFLGFFKNFHSEKKIPNVAKGIFQYASAGHFSPFIIRNKLDTITLKTKGSLLGVFQNIPIEEFEVEYYSGDRFIFFTDGLLEAKNSKSEILGEEKLFQIFESTKNLDGDSSIKKIFDEIYSYTDCEKINDDLTLLIIDID